MNGQLVEKQIQWLRNTERCSSSPKVRGMQINDEMTSLVAQTVKRLSKIRETWVQSLGQEDPLEKEMAIHSSTIAWKVPWTEEPGRLQSMGSQKVRHN